MLYVLKLAQTHLYRCFTLPAGVSQSNIKKLNYTQCVVPVTGSPSLAVASP